MQAVRRIENKVPCRQLDFMGAIIVLDDEFAAIVLIRRRQKERHRQIGADAHPGEMIAAHRVIDMHAEMVTNAVAIEQRWKDMERDRSRNKKRARGKGTDDTPAQRP